MNKLEPTYIRYVYDELGRGSLSSDNASSLPYGFIGLFEKEFSSDIPLSRRSTILRRLSLWALLKKAVSIEFVSEVLKENTDSTKSLIDTYSKWFNSTEPGKYVLFHDRLRSYLIQKLSDHEVHDLNEQLIAYLEQSLEGSIGKESELYALEYLSTHMAVESQLENNYNRLNDFVNREDLWPRQIRASKEYKWSQKGIQYGIMEGARRQNNEKLQLATRKSIKLQEYEESNFKEILNLIENDELDLCLKRTFNWEGEKKCKLLLLILIETLFGKFKSKDIDNAFFIEIVNHLKYLLCKENNTKIGESSNEIISNSENFIITWSIFFPQLTMYYIHLALVNREIDFSFIWNVIEHIDFKQLFNHDYGSVAEKNKWLIPIVNDVLYNQTNYEIIIDNFSELGVFAIKNNYPSTFKECLRVINLSIDGLNIEEEDYYNYYIKVYDKLFRDDLVVLFDVSEIKNELISKLIDRVDKISDFHSKKNVLGILSKSLYSSNSHEIISSKIVDLYSSTKYSDEYFLKATFEFSILLYESHNYIKSFELIKDKNIYSYQHLINLLKSKIENSYKLIIIKKIINSLNSETNYNIPINGGESSDELMQRGEVIIELANYYIELGDTTSALELANKIDVLKEYNITSDKIWFLFKRIATKMVGNEKEGCVFNYNKFKDLFIENGEYINYKVNQSELISFVEKKIEDKEQLDLTENPIKISSKILDFLFEIISSEGQYICAEENDLLHNLLINDHYDLSFDLIRLLPMESSFMRNKQYVDLCFHLLKMGRINDSKLIFDKIDTEIFKFQFSVGLIKNYVNNNKFNECFELVKKFNNPILKIFLIFQIKIFISKSPNKNINNKMLNEIKSTIQNLNYLNIIIKISELILLQNNVDFPKLIGNLKNKEAWASKWDESELYYDSTTKSEPLDVDEKVNDFFENFHQGLPSDTTSSAMDLLYYYNSINDKANFNFIFEKFSFIISKESSINDAISNSFKNIININNEKHNQVNKSFANDILNYIKSNHITVETISLYNCINNFFNTPYSEFIISNNLILSDLDYSGRGDKISDVIALINQQYSKKIKSYYSNFIGNVNCEKETRIKLLDELFKNDELLFLDIENLNQIANFKLQSSQKVILINYAFLKKKSIDEILFDTPNKRNITNSINEKILKNELKSKYKELVKKNHFKIDLELINKCADNNKLLYFNRENLGKLSETLSSLGLFSEAIFISEYITDDEIPYYKYDGYYDGERTNQNSLKSFVLETISIDLLKNGFVDKSIIIANKIHDVNIRFLLYNRLRFFMKTNFNNYIFSYEQEIFKLYNNQSTIPSSTYTENIANAFMTDINEIFNSLITQFKTLKHISSEKLDISIRISKFVDKYLTLDDVYCDDFTENAVLFFSDIKLIEDNVKLFSGYLDKILSKTDNYIQEIITENKPPNEFGNEKLYVGELLVNLCKSLYKKEFLIHREKYLKILIDIIKSPIIFEMSDIRWDSYYQNEPYNDKINEQTSWLRYSKLSFDVFKILSFNKDQNAYLFLETSINYVNESSIQFLKNNQIHDLAKAFSDLEWNGGVRGPKYHHTAKPNEVYIEMLKYFSNKNDKENFDRILNLYSSPNSNYKYISSSIEFKYISLFDLKKDSDSTEISIANLIRFNIYMLSELCEFSVQFEKNLKLLISLNENKIVNQTNRSSNYLKTCELLLNSLRFSREINDENTCEKIISYINLLNIKLSKNDFMNHCFDRFKYLSNEEALSFYNSNNKVFDKIIFSNRIVDLINDEKINIHNHFAFSNTFSFNNIILEKCITKTLDTSTH